MKKNMKIRLVNTLVGGETLAESVITGEQETLISKGTVLKPEYLDLLTFLGIDTVCIEDPYGEYEMPHHIFSNEKRSEYIQKVQKILEGHIYQSKCSLEEMVNLADAMVEELLQVDENIVIDMEERTGNLYEHTVMVTILSVMTARKLKLDEAVLHRIAIGCLLHDLGIRYITVPYVNCDMTNGKEKEVFQYKKHTILAYSALMGETWIDPVAKKMILSHHERKDGSGFPLRQKIKEIECNILQVCDTFDCMISGMECKRIGIQKALEYLIETSDILFERKIVKVLQKMVAYYPAGSIVKLNTGETGLVISQTENSIRPVIRVLDAKKQITDVTYDLVKNKKVSILEII